MATIVTRAGKGSPLTHNEVDANFNNLNTDKVETSSVSAFGATLIDDADAATARTTLGLGTAATTASTDYATAAQGSLAASAVQPNDSPTFGNITVTGTVDGRDVSVDGAKLDGIEAGADVTDTANVTAAGALMDSELANIAAVKALNQGVATTDSPSFAGLTVNGQLGAGGANYGTSGQVLTSNGAASAPSWQASSSVSEATEAQAYAATATDVYISPDKMRAIGPLQNVFSNSVNSRITSSQTWNFPFNVRVGALLVGGGGGGGNALSTSDGRAALATGGGGGAVGYIEFDVPANNDIVLTIGAGGIADSDSTGSATTADNDGTAGGNTSIVCTAAGVNAVAGGGSKGTGFINLSANTSYTLNGSSGGTATGFDISRSGGASGNATSSGTNEVPAATSGGLAPIFQTTGIDSPNVTNSLTGDYQTYVATATPVNLSVSSNFGSYDLEPWGTILSHTNTAGVGMQASKNDAGTAGSSFTTAAPSYGNGGGGFASVPDASGDGYFIATGQDGGDGVAMVRIIRTGW